MPVQKGSPEFHKMLDKMREIHNKKNEDYSESNNAFSNFEISAEILKHFKYPTDQIYVALISTKLARLSALLNSERKPNNESIRDSFIDLANYVLLWGSSKK